MATVTPPAAPGPAAVAASDSAESSYDALAPFYDRFTAHHDYERWTAMIENLACTHGLRGRRLLDVACGTGKSYEPFLARGYDVTASDVSDAMLEIARAKAPGMTLLRRDMRRLERLGRFDLVTCLDDALNHLLTAEELIRAFRGVRLNLARDGVFVFDVNTLACYRRFFAQPMVVEDDDCMLVWQGRGDGDASPGSLAEATLDAFAAEPDGRFRHVATRHRQRHHPRPVVERTLALAGLRCAAVYGQDLASNAEPELDEVRHTKAVYVACHAHASDHGRR